MACQGHFQQIAYTLKEGRGRREKGLQLQQNENTGTKCLSQEKENQKVKDSMSNRQNIQDIRGWFKTEEKEIECVPRAKQYQKDKE